MARVIAALREQPNPGHAGLAAGAIRVDTSETLTPRELQVVALVRIGCMNKEIAYELGITEGTVKKHLQSVFAKLGVHRRTLVALGRLPSAGATLSVTQSRTRTRGATSTARLRLH
jgi:DNA-binding NarL/FixJ family response regulator